MKKKPYFKSLVILLTILCLARTGAGAFAGNPGLKKPQKEEAVYVRLHTDGTVKEVYVLNSFEVEEEGEFIDYGDYSEVKNLTAANSLTVNNRLVNIRAPEGKFLYQGKLKNPVLPWIVKIRYFLNGLPVAPEKVAGSTGQLDICLDITDNPDATNVFTDNYALQITMTFDTDLFTDLQAEGGTLALAGKNKVVNFMKLPGQNKGEYRVSLQVKDFEMEGIQISGVPLSLDFQLPEDNDLAADLVQLEDAIKEINTGVGSISQGTAELKKGFDGFQEALENLHAGLEELEENFSLLVGSNKELSDASAMINAALEEIKNNLPPSGNPAGSDLKELGEASGAFLQGTGALAAGLGGLEEGFNQADAAIQQQSGGAYAGLLHANEALIASLEQKIGALMADPVGNAEQIEELMSLKIILAANTQLLAGVRRGIAGNGSGSPGLADAAAELATGYTQFDAAIQNLVSELSETAGGMDQLKAGIEELAANYSQFHAGLESYLSGNLLIKEGVSALKSGLQKTAAGGNQLQEAVTSLHGGMEELATGTDLLQKETGGMDEKMAAEIESYLARYTGKDFEPVSFAAEENNNVTLVQFIMLTDALKMEAEEAPEPQEEEKSSFWQRFLGLFSDFRSLLKFLSQAVKGHTDFSFNLRERFDL